MAEYVKLTEDAEYLTVVFDVGDEKVLAVGERLNDACEDAYMNGENWDALLSVYLKKKVRALVFGLETDPEAGMLSLYYENTEENRPRAQALAELIEELVEDGDELVEFVEENAGEIEWD